MNLELKHLAPYLPYGLKYSVFNKKGKLDLLEIGTNNIYNIITAVNKGVYGGEYKPILRPLSDLTKEIEVNGEKFVPLEILGQKHIEDGFFEDGSFGWGQSTGGDDEQDYYLTVSNNEGFYLVFDIWCGHQDEGGYCVDNENIPFPLVELFFKWHFDVFGLIEKGLAIDINTIFRILRNEQ